MENKKNKNGFTPSPENGIASRFFSKGKSLVMGTAKSVFHNIVKRRREKTMPFFGAGFTLLFTLLIISVALSISIGVSFLLLEELKLSGTAKDSQIAFYVADSGVECVMYWDFRKHLFFLEGGSVECGGQTITTHAGGTSFDLPLSADGFPCAAVLVSGGAGLSSSITSKGYNTTCESASPRKTERGLQVTY